VNQDRLDASITIGDKDPYCFGTIDKSQRVKSAVLGRRGIKTSSSTRAMSRKRTLIGS